MILALYSSDKDILIIKTVQDLKQKIVKLNQICLDFYWISLLCKNYENQFDSKFFQLI